MSGRGEGGRTGSADLADECRGAVKVEAGRVQPGQTAGPDAEGPGESRGHRLLNPPLDGMQRVPKLPCEQQGLMAVPFLEEAFAIDPESLAVWQLGEGDLPRCEGFKLNFGCSQMAHPRAVCLSLTRACNLRCRYCYVHNRPDLRDGSMSVETAVAGIQLCEPKGTSISFFGGEPLLCFDTVQRVVSEAERVCERPRFHITTNGVLLDDDRAEFFKAHGFSFIVSLDGPADVHNRNRPLAAGESRHGDSHGLTVEGLKALKRHGIAERVTLRSTYTNDCIHLKERLAYLNELCERGYGGQVAVEAVSSSESSCIDPYLAAEIGIGVGDALRLQKDYREAFDWVLGQVRAGKRVRWHHLNHFANRVVSRSPSPTECGAGKGYISIAPGGEVFACHREAGRPIGHVKRGIDESARACWLENRLFARRDCPDCWCRFACGGGCRADSIVHQGDITEPYPTSCTLSQIIIANVIRLLSRLTPDESALVTADKRTRR